MAKERPQTVFHRLVDVLCTLPAQYASAPYGRTTINKFLGTALGLAASVGMMATAVPAAAVPGNNASDNAAFVINNSGCGGTLQTSEGLVTVSTEDGAIQLATKSGNAKFNCALYVTAGPELKRTLKVEGFNCFTPLGSASESRAVITPSGRAHVVCRLRL